jgi:hypothetical protein
MEVSTEPVDSGEDPPEYLPSSSCNEWLAKLNYLYTFRKHMEQTTLSMCSNTYLCIVCFKNCLSPHIIIADWWPRVHVFLIIHIRSISSSTGKEVLYLQFKQSQWQWLKKIVAPKLSSFNEEKGNYPEMTKKWSHLPFS